MMSLGMHKYTVLTILWCLILPNNGEIRTDPKCLPEEPVCEFFLRISSYWTMMHFISYGMMEPVVIDENGTYYARSKSCDKLIELNETEASNVIIGDGTQKPVLVFNKQLPGPSIVVYEGQQVIVKVKNDMSGYVTTVHWHGQTMDGTPYMDGVADVSQYPIPPRQTFTYRFNATRVGTHWYHTHLGTQRSEGAYGPLVVLPQPQKKPAVEKYEDDFIMVVSDWMHEASSSIQLRMMHDNLLYPYGYDNDTCFRMTVGVDGLQVGITPFVSAIVNGKGRYYPESGGEAQNPYIPLEKFTVQKKSSSKVRFRMISSAMIFSFKVSIDHHDLHLIATDGDDVDPVTVQYIIIHAGERFDFWIEPTDPVNASSYWIRLTTLEYTQNGRSKPAGHTAAILKYKESLEEVIDPGTKGHTCTSQNSCKILNCPYMNYPEAFHLQCVSLDSLRAKEKKPIMSPKTDDDFVEIFLNYHFSGASTLHMFKPNVNGKVFVPADKPLQVQTILGKANNIPCNDTLCAEDVCFCTHQIDIPLNKVVQMVIFTTMPELSSFITGTHHPVHLHGHHMEIIKVAYPTYDEETGLFKATNSDIKCQFNELCNEATWSNSSWKYGNIPDIIQHGAPTKDTLVVPGGGYVVARFRSDNPGFWLMHCHVEIHNVMGMSLVIKEGTLEDMPVPPNKRPSSVDGHSHETAAGNGIEPLLLQKPSSGQLKADIGEAQTQQTNGMETCSAEADNYLAVITVSAVISLVLLLLLVWLLRRSMCQHYNTSPSESHKADLLGNSENNETEPLLM